MHGDWFLGCERRYAIDLEYFVSSQTKGLAVFSRLEFEREHTHADEVAAVNAFVAFSDDRADAEQSRAFCRPIARRAGTVFFSGDDDQRHTGLTIFHGGVVD